MSEQLQDDIPAGLRAVIELTAERAATKAIEKHEARCSIGKLWDCRDSDSRRLRRLEIILAVVATSGSVGVVGWKLVAALTGA